MVRAYPPRCTRDGWTWPELELRGRYAYTAVHVDLDESQAHARVLKGINNGLIPTPNWLVERMVAGHGHGHAHVAWTLAHPVYRGAKARVAPLQDLARTNEYLASILKGNPGFAAVLVHNPVADLTDFRTHWMARQPYTLRELLAYVPKGWRRPRQPRTAVARDIHLFENGIRWTGRKANLDLPVFDYLMQLNGALAYPLGTLEVAGIAHRIEHLPGHPPAGTEPQ